MGSAWGLVGTALLRSVGPVTVQRKAFSFRFFGSRVYGPTRPLCLARAQEVSFRRCTKLTDKGLAALAQSGTLRSLNVALVPRVGPATLKALAARCRCPPARWPAALGVQCLHVCKYCS